MHGHQRPVRIVSVHLIRKEPIGGVLRPGDRDQHQTRRFGPAVGTVGGGQLGWAILRGREFVPGIGDDPEASVPDIVGRARVVDGADAGGLKDAVDLRARAISVGINRVCGVTGNGPLCRQYVRVDVVHRSGIPEVFEQRGRAAVQPRQFGSGRRIGKRRIGQDDGRSRLLLKDGESIIVTRIDEVPADGDALVHYPQVWADVGDPGRTRGAAPVADALRGGPGQDEALLGLKVG